MDELENTKSAIECVHSCIADFAQSGPVKETHAAPPSGKAWCTSFRPPYGYPRLRLVLPDRGR